MKRISEESGRKGYRANYGKRLKKREDSGEEAMKGVIEGIEL